MGRFALIVVLTLILLLSFFVIANNRQKLETSHRLIGHHYHNQSKNISNSALEIGVMKITDLDWEVEDGETWHLGTGSVWVQKGLNDPTYFHEWNELNGSYALEATRDGDFITLTSLGRVTATYANQFETKALLEVIPEDDEEEINFPDFEGIFSKGGFELTGSSQIHGSAGTNSIFNETVDFAWSTGIVSGNLTIGPGGVPGNVVKSPRPNFMDHIDGGNGTVDNLEEPLDFPMPSFPEFPTLPERGNFSTPWVEGTFYLIDQDGRYDNIEVTSNRTLTVDVGSGTRRIVDNNFNITQGHLVLVGSGNLIMYIENSFSIGGGTRVNEHGDTERVHTYYAGANQLDFAGNTRYNGSIFIQNAGLRIGGSGSISGHVISGGNSVEIYGNAEADVRLLYAPEANINLTGSGRIRGNVVGNHIQLVGNARIFFDDSWGDITPPDFGDPNEMETGVIIHLYTY